MFSVTQFTAQQEYYRNVLILVLLEDVLSATHRHALAIAFGVLILVLFEDVLSVPANLLQEVQDRGLNPCFIGRCSQWVPYFTLRIRPPVLILVLLEDVLSDYCIIY